jgi:hypothetical protein
MGIIKNFNEFSNINKGRKLDINNRSIEKSPKENIVPEKTSNVNNETKQTESKNVLESVKFVNKIAIFNNNIKANEAYTLLEKSNVSKHKLLYFLMERNINTLQLVKYNNETKVDLCKFISELFTYYEKNNILLDERIELSGCKDFIVIKNIPANLKTKIKEDLINLLSK